MKILGVDPSTWAGLLLLEGEQASPRMIDFPDRSGWKRLQSIATAFAGRLEELNPDVVYVEGYAIKNKFNLILMVEIGTIMRHVLYKAGVEWWDVPPTVLKKWTTGNGRADKPMMAKSVKERWGFTHASDDVIDAYALARLGQLIQSGKVSASTLKITHGHKLTKAKP